jgi:metal-sulfur cluster biosynthetic enzyme
MALSPLDAEDIHDLLAEILDPERDGLTLGDLSVVAPDRVAVAYAPPDGKRAVVTVTLRPTVPHCGFMLLIALTVFAKLQQDLPGNINWKVDIAVEPGSHQQGDEIVKQVNDKERVAAALENPQLRQEVERLINPFANVH